MAKRSLTRKRRATLLAHELLDFYDEVTAHNAATLFLLQALAAKVEEEGTRGKRFTYGASICVQRLADEATRLEKRLTQIRQDAGRTSIS